MIKKLPLVLIPVLLFFAVATLKAADFKSVWKSSDVTKLNFAGKKIAALVISEDQSLQMSGEEALVRELNARKVTGTATYRFVPREELKSPEKARGWYDRAGVEGVVALRPVSYTAASKGSPIVWSSYTQNFWGYYGMGWNGGVSISRADNDARIVVETLVFSLKPDRLVWAATSETKNPKNVQSFVEDLVNDVVQEMRKMKLVSQS
jgi:hypothetical protein